MSIIKYLDSYPDSFPDYHAAKSYDVDDLEVACPVLASYADASCHLPGPSEDRSCAEVRSCPPAYAGASCPADAGPAAVRTGPACRRGVRAVPGEGLACGGGAT